MLTESSEEREIRLHSRRNLMQGTRYTCMLEGCKSKKGYAQVTEISNCRKQPSLGVGR